MDTMAISIKMLCSKEYKNSHTNMRNALLLLKNQLKLTQKLIKDNDELRRGYEQYRTYSHNKRKDKITTIPCNPVYSYLTHSLLQSINDFFEWEEKHKQK